MSEDEKKKSAASSSSTGRDVHFLGPGHHANVARANQEAYQQLLQNHYEEYEGLEKHAKRDFVFEKIVQPVLDSGGRFFDRDGSLLDASEEQGKQRIFETVSQSLRDKARKPPKRAKKAPSSTGIQQEVETLREDVVAKKEELDSFMSAVSYVKTESERLASENQQLRAEVARLQQENQDLRRALWGVPPA
jgi:hypothetical protein